MRLETFLYMKSKIIMLYSYILIGMLLGGCASYAHVTKTWQSPEAQATTYHKLLVIGITKEPDLRQSFENIFAETLRDHGVAAEPSYEKVPDLGNTDHLQIQTLAKGFGADGVIITRVLTKSENTEYLLASGHVEQRTVIEGTSNGNSSAALVMSGVGIVPGEMDSAGAKLETTLFDVASKKPVWSALISAAGSDNERMDVVWELSNNLTKALSKDHMIEINSKEFHIPSL
jgi:hypothetical protein